MFRGLAPGLRVCSRAQNGLRSQAGLKMPVVLPSFKQPVRNYASGREEKGPKIRYLFYVFLLSSLTIYIGGQKVDKKRHRSSFSSQQEFDEYEQATGLKRRSRLIDAAGSEKYKFYGVPYFTDDTLVEKIKKSLGPTKVKEIDVNQLIQQEMADDTRKYCFLLQDLAHKKKPYPNGLLTALIKNEVQFYINTSQGIYDTNFILKNYPRNTDEASKFETDVASLEKIIVTKDDVADHLPTQLPDDQVRKINNVVSYFETVGKSTILDSVNDDIEI